MTQLKITKLYPNIGAFTVHVNWDAVDIDIRGFKDLFRGVFRDAIALRYPLLHINPREADGWVDRLDVHYTVFTPEAQRMVWDDERLRLQSELREFWNQTLNHLILQHAAQSWLELHNGE